MLQPPLSSIADRRNGVGVGRQQFRLFSSKFGWNGSCGNGCSSFLSCAAQEKRVSRYIYMHHNGGEAFGLIVSYLVTEVFHYREIGRKISNWRSNRRNNEILRVARRRRIRAGACCTTLFGRHALKCQQRCWPNLSTVPLR